MPSIPARFPSALPRIAGVTLLLSVLLAPSLAAQALDGSGMVATGLLLRQMDGVKRVLMIGAHPDDEDTSLLTAMARGIGAQTAYLSLTRGDGGQNLIGPQLWEGLGVIRTGELEAARRLDGGQQFFTRAFDFGYSKTADEALTLWSSEELLHDVVWTVRRFRPHVIVAVFSGTPRDGHGHHQASGILAREAFAAAGDPTRFPDQLERGVEAWTPSKLYQVIRRNPSQATGSVDTGWLDPLLGRSLYQLSMLSRSQHRSQDMGAPQPPGPRQAFVQFIESRVGGDADSDVFEGIDTTLVSVAQGLPAAEARETAAYLEDYRAAVQRARDEFGLDASTTIGPLRDALGSLQSAMEVAWEPGNEEVRSVLEHKLDLTTRALLAASGIVVDVRSEDDLVTPGQGVQVRVQLWNGGTQTLHDVEPGVRLPFGWDAEITLSSGVGPDGTVGPGTLAVWTYEVTIPEDAALSRLYYLREARQGDSYQWPDDDALWGLPRDPAPVSGTLDFTLGSADGTPVEAMAPWRFVGVDQARGEFVKPVLTVPALSARVTPSGLVWPQVRREAGTVTVTVTNYGRTDQSGSVRIDAPDDWSVSPASHPFELAGEGAERTVSFQVSPRGVPSAGEHALRAIVSSDAGGEYTEGVSLIDYEHIERAALFDDAEARITVVPVQVTEGLRVGYVMGTGDGGPEAIRQLGGQVELLDADAVRDGAFDGYDVVVLGVRAYETRDDLKAANAQLLDYARAGGTVVVQYNQYQYSRGQFAPYPMEIGRPAPRVADQNAPVTILQPEAPVFTTPNQITQADFEGWAQERGLYVYAALSFFRQFPSGVPGAYRLFANLISLTADDWAEFEDARSEGNDRD